MKEGERKEGERKEGERKEGMCFMDASFVR
jgi:hypothetical protein